jgi:hypothetical protein
MAIETPPWFADYPPQTMPIVPPTLVTVGPLVLEQEWVDPLTGLLQHLGVPQSDAVLRLDGSHYTLYVETWAIALALAFGVPRTAPLIELERALLRTAGALAAKDSTGTIAEYVQHWRRHTTVS